METYKITYQLFDNAGNKIKFGTIKVKNSKSEFIAKCGLEDYMKRKYPKMAKMEISRCIKLNPITDIFDSFSR